MGEYFIKQQSNSVAVPLPPLRPLYPSFLDIYPFFYVERLRSLDLYLRGRLERRVERVTAPIRPAAFRSESGSTAASPGISGGSSPFRRAGGPRRRRCGPGRERAEPSATKKGAVCSRF
jgi:hypothetical protein